MYREGWALGDARRRTLKHDEMIEGGADGKLEALENPGGARTIPFARSNRRT
jgi:hypothetical protein